MYRKKEARSANYGQQYINKTSKLALSSKWKVFISGNTHHCFKLFDLLDRQAVPRG